IGLALSRLARVALARLGVRLAGLGEPAFGIELVTGLTRLILRRLLSRSLLLSGRLLLMLPLLLQQLLDRVAIVASVVKIGIELESAVICRNRRTELPGARERVAAVVMRRRGVEPGKRCRARLIVAGAILRRGPPFGILEQLGGPLRRAALESGSGTLIRATARRPPEIPETSVVGARGRWLALGDRLRIGVRREREQEDRDHGDPAAPETERDQRKQQHGEPRSRVAPRVGDVD